MFKPVISSFAFAVAVASPTVVSDTIVTFNASGSDSPNKISIHSGMVQMPAPQGDVRLVMDTNSRNMLMIDDSKKQYMAMNTETIKKTSDMMEGVRKQMMAQMKNMPEAQRKMLEQRMGVNLDQPAVPKITIKATGKKKSVSNVKCEIHDVLSDGKKTMEACVATVKASGVAEADYKTMKNMFEMSREFAKQSAKMGGPTAGNSVANMPDLNGVPMEVKNLADGHSITITEIDSKAKLADAQFKPGSDYKKIDPLQQMQQQMGGMPAPGK